MNVSMRTLFCYGNEEKSAERVLNHMLLYPSITTKAIIIKLNVHVYVKLFATHISVLIMINFMAIILSSMDDSG